MIRSDSNKSNNKSAETRLDKIPVQINADKKMSKLNSSSSLPEAIIPWQGKQQLSLKLKATVWAIALTIFPVLVVGITSDLSNQSTIKQLTQAQPTSAIERREIELALQENRFNLLLKTGVIAFLAGAIAALMANRATRKVLLVTEISNTLVNRLRREEIETRSRVAGKDELVALEANINLLQEQLPELLWKQEAETERSQLLMNITRRIQEALSEEDVLRTTVEEIRKAFRIDRVVIFRFDSNGSGTFVEEAAAPGWPKTLWATLSDPCFEGGYVEQYQQGRIRAINNIYQANLKDCHIGLLERFAVKASLIAPILRGNQLFSLLIGHQCSAPRFWQQSEIDLFAQIATQVGFALDHARLVEQIDNRANQAQTIINITRRIRRSLNEADVLKTTVDEIRKAIATDRVIVYSFDVEWYGTVVAEAVLPGFPKTLLANIKDPCFAEGYVEQYQAGRVRAINNIYEAGLSACHISQLEPFAVKANLVAPILKDEQLFGLIIAHHCSAPREWQQFEIDLLAQLAIQVGFALDHARLLNQVDQAYTSVEYAFREQQQQQQALQEQVSELLRDSETVVETLSSETFQQMASVTSAYNQIQALANSAQEMLFCVQQTERQKQQFSHIIRDGQKDTHLIVEGTHTIQATVEAAFDRVQRLDQPSQKLSQIVNLIVQVASQFKFYAMKIALEAARAGEASREFSSIAEKFLSLAQELDTNITEIKSFVAEIHIANHEVVVLMDTGKVQAIALTQAVDQTEQKLNQINAISTQMNILIEELTQAATNQVATSTAASQSILEVASITNQTSEKAVTMAKSLAKLTASASHPTQN